MSEKRTSLFENGLIWFGAGVSIAESPDRNVSGFAGHEKGIGSDSCGASDRMHPVVPCRCDRW